MVEIHYDHEFEKQVAKLEPRLRTKLAQQLERITENPYDPRLHSKPLSEPFAGALSFRITRDWRVTYHSQSAVIIRLLEVKHRKDIYR